MAEDADRRLANRCVNAASRVALARIGVGALPSHRNRLGDQRALGGLTRFLRYSQPAVELPDALAEQAKEAGLLEPDAVERLVREALLARRVESLVQAREVFAARPLPPMTSDEIQAEIDAYRAEVRRAARP
jgi:hypothetical protein